MPDAYRIIFSARASADLRGIFDYIARDSPRNAAQMVERILDTIEGLKLFPHRTVVAGSRSRRGAVRALPVRPYIVFFRVIETERVVRVLLVRHGARRRPARFE